MAETKWPVCQEKACLGVAASPSPAGRSSENGPGAVVEAVVPTAYLSTGPWYKGLYNMLHFHTLLLHLSEGTKSQV
jgi:hypothetical protein